MSSSMQSVFSQVFLGLCPQSVSHDFRNKFPHAFQLINIAILKAFETIFGPFPCPTVFPKKNNVHARSVGFLAFSNAQILTLGEAVTSLLLSLGGSREGSKQNR